MAFATLIRRLWRALSGPTSGTCASMACRVTALAIFSVAPFLPSHRASQTCRAPTLQIAFDLIRRRTMSTVAVVLPAI
jgi:hypothetical protein